MSRIFTFVICFCLLIGTGYAYDQFWDRMRTPTGALATDTRTDSQTTSEMFLFTNNLGVVNENIIGKVDHRPYVNVFKSYKTNIVHSFGPRLTQNEKRALAKLSMDKYLVRKLDADTDLLTRTADTYRKSTRLSETAVLFHRNSPFGEMKTRIRFVFNGNAMITQEVFVQPDDLKDATVIGYFDNLSFNAGFVESDKTIFENWNTYISPYRTFSAYVPPLIKPYRTEEVKITKSDNASVGKYTIFDPVRRQKLHYHLYEYIYKRDLTFEMVEAIIKKRHIERYGREPSMVPLKKGIEKDTPYIRVSYNIKASNEAPYASRVNIRAFFDGNVVFVQEMIGSELLSDTALASTLMTTATFHPQHKRTSSDQQD